MNFEDALILMKQGKKITHELLGENVYLQACRLSLPGDDTPLDEHRLSIVKMLGNVQHPDMNTKECFNMFCKHGGMPQLNLFLVMYDDWEVLDSDHAE